MPSIETVLARGNVAVITGGASGIGLAVAERLLERGMAVVLADIDEPKLRAVESRLSESGGAVIGVICDTASEPAVAALAEVALERFGGAHLLFNNAGIAGVGDAWGGSMALWDRVIGINLYGVVHGVRAFLPIMTEQGVGHIVNTASMAGLLGMPGAAPYNATKHGVVAISESLYSELQMTGSPVGVSVLCPGFVKTDLMTKEATAAPDSIGAIMGELLTAGVDAGMAASDVADQVVAAVDARQFWILTHEDMRELPVERMRGAASQINPPAMGAI